MNATALLIGLGPLLGWGLFPTIASKIGGRPVNQILGTSLGTLIFAAIFSMINGLAFPRAWIYSFQFYLVSVGPVRKSLRLNASR